MNVSNALTEEMAGGEILLVEDDAGDALLVQELLTDAFQAGHSADLETVWVTSIAGVSAKLSRRTRCILLDLGLPDSEGLEGLRRVLQLAGRLPVIVLTGRVDRETGEAAVAEGAQDYLVKGSVGAEALTRSIRYAIERRRGQETSRRLAEAELQAAEKARLERGLLPRPVISNPALKWATRYRPGGGRALLGGDFYDGIELPDGTVRVLVGDVTGHGPDEAALGVALRVAWRSLVLAGTAPDVVLRELQRIHMLERHAEDVFATVCDLSLSPDLRSGQLRLGGHPCPLVIHDPKVTEVTLQSRGPLIGLLDDAHWPAGHVDLGHEWALLFFTDGIIEGRTPNGERLDEDGLIHLATEAVATGCGLGGLADELIAGAERANGGPLPDDVAMFLLATGPRW